MENKLRRGLALLMTLIMLISCAPMDALAAIVPVSGGTQTSDGFALKSIVKPPVATHTYVFMNGDTEFARQIVKGGESLNNPGTPDSGSPNKEFTGWLDENHQAPAFGEVNVTETKTITYHAQFDDVYFVFFTNEKGEVMVTEKGKAGDTIFTDGVTYPVGNEESIVGWKDKNGNTVTSVTLTDHDVTLTADVVSGHWITYDSQGGTYVAPAFVKGNGTTTAPAAPTRPGYTFRHWSATVGGAAFNFGNALTTALTLYAVWTPNTRTQYTVIHWQENADDDEYSYAESETKYGATGAQTSAAAKSYPGFTAQDITQQTIAGDGSTIVNVYYLRNVYKVNFNEKHKHTYDRRTGNFFSGYTYYGGCYPQNGGSSTICGLSTDSWVATQTITAKYGANISTQWPVGTFWYVTQDDQTTAQSNLDTMPLGGKEFYGKAEGSGTANYYVQVLPGESGTENAGGKTYKLDHTDTGYTSGTVTDEERYEMTGFTCNLQHSAKNGASYPGAKFYYDRNSYNVVYINNGVTVKTTSYYYEQSISDAGSYTPARPSTLPDTFTFGGWYADPAGGQAYTFNGKTMPAQNVTVYAKWNEPTVNGTAHIKIDGTDAGTTLEGVKYGGTITEQLNALQETIMQDKDGYTWRGWRTGPNGTGEPFNVDTKIYSDITLYPYYTKDGTFTVEYVSGKNNVTAPVDGKSYAEDSFADLMSPGKLVADDGEYFLGWSDGAATYQPRDKYQIKSNHADERNVITLTAQWGARPAGTTLTYKANGGAGEDVVKNLANNETVTTIANPFSRVGYTFKGWDTNPKGEGSIAPNTQVQVDNGNGENVLYAIWTANTNTKYTVEFYYQNTDGTYPQKANESVPRFGTTDMTASVTDEDKADKKDGQYTYDTAAANVESGTITGDGSLVLKLYFKLNTASYTIHHYLNGTTVKVADDQTGAMTIGEELTANKSNALYLAYAAAVVAGYAPSQTITIAADESENVITVYYTVPLTITAGDANKTYDGQPLTQPDFTMKGLVNGDTKENFSLSMTADSTITNAGSTPNVINTDTVKYNGGAIPSYYNVSYKPGTLTVNKASATVTITGVNETHVYDGTQYVVNGYNYSFTGKPNEITISLKPNVLAIARRTDVGTTYMGLTKDSFTVTSANYDVTIKAVIDGYVTITPIETEIVITANSASKKYDGTPLTDDGFIFTEGVLVKGDVLTAVVEGSATNVGDEGRNVVKSYKVMRGDVDVTGNYTFGNSIDGKLTINKREVTLTSASDSKTYDGKPLTNSNVTIGGQAFADGEGATFNVTGTITNVGKMPNDFTYTLNEGTNANNYTITPTAGELEVTPVTDEVVVTITGQKVTTKYDGTEHAASGYDVSISNELYKEADFTFTGSAEVKATDASDTAYAMGLKDTDFANKNGNFSNVTFIVTDGSLTINKRTVTLKSEGGSKEYDGTPLTKPDVTVGGDGFVAGEVTDVKATGSVTFVHEGEVANTITYTEGANFKGTNYTISKEEGKLSITKREGEGKTITVIAANGEKVYDGTPLTNNGFTHVGALVEGDVLTAVVEGSQTDVGVGDNVVRSYKVMRGDVNVTTSYTFTDSVKGALTVTLRDVTFTGESKSLPYTGGMQSITGITQSGLVEGHRYEGLTYKAEGQNVDSYDGAFSGDVVIKDAQGNDVTKNYNVTKTPGKLTITNASFTVTFTGENAEKIYNGKEQSITGITVAGLKTGHRYEGLTYEAKGTDKGEYVGAFTGTVKILDENNVDVTENYAVTTTPGKLTITAVETEVVVTIKGKTDTVEYDGQKHEVNGYEVVSISNTLYTEADFDFADGATAHAEGTDAGDYFMNLTKESFVNRNANFSAVTFVVEDGKLTITKRGADENKAKITANDNTVNYDGQPHGAKLNAAGQIEVNVSYTTEYLAPGHKVQTVAIDGSQTAVGKYPKELVPSGAIIVDKNDNDVTENYVITYVPGTLEIRKNETEIKVTANSHTWEYDGQAHSDGGYTVNYNGVDYPVAAGEFATLPTGDKVTATVDGSVTNVADSADDNNVVTNVTITNKTGTVVSDQYKTITRVNGGLKITRRGDSEDEDKKVKIIAEPNTVGYDGQSHGAKLNAAGEIELGTSYTTARLVDGHYVDETTLDITGSQMNVGVYEEELKPAVKAGATRIVILDAKGNDVTDNYALTLVNATLTITGDKLIPDKKAEDENIESNYKLGDEIEFTITVKNVSIYDVENVTVTDANAEIKAGNGYTVSADKHTATIAIIAAKSEIRIKALHTVTSEDILAGKVGNVANVEWKDGETTVTKTVDDDTTKLTPPNVTLNVTKTSDWEGKATGAKPELGTKITYTITVKNDGNVPYTNVNFTDLLQNGDASVTGEIPTYGTLPVNEEKSFTVEYIVTEADLLKESINNKVTAEADEIEYTYYEGKTEKTGKATPKGEAEVTDRTDDAKASTISTKTTTSKPKNEKGYELGETITYDIVVTNDGNLTVTDIEVKEELAGAVIKESTDGAYTVDGSIAKIAELKPGQSVTVKVEYVVTEADILAGSVKNEATVTGKGPDDKNPDPDKPGTEDPTDTPKAELNIEKSVLNAYTDNTPFKLGEKIEYQLTITTPETNNVTVKDVKVTDTLLTKANEGKFEITSLPEGAAAAYDNDGKLIITMPNIDPGKHELVIKYTYTVQETDLGTVKDGKATLGTVHNAATVAGTTDDPKVIPGSEDGNDVSTVAKLTITANDNSHVYDGKSHGARLNDNGQIKQNVSYTLDAELLDGHEIESVDIPFTAILVGVYDSEETGWLMPENAKIITAGGEDVTSKYYKITYVPGTLTITASTKELKIVANSTTWTYNGEQHTDGGYTVTYGNESYTVKAGESATLSTGDKVTAVVKGQVKDVDDTKAGNNEIVEWSVEHRDFYNNVTPANGTLTITPRKVTLKSDGGSKKYDGTPLTKPEVTVTGDGFVVGEVTGITATGSVTYVSQGEVDNLITFTKNEGFKDSNYEIKEIIGKLSIEALDVTIIITGPSAIREYKPGVTHTIVTGGSELDFVYGSDKVDGKIGVEGMLEGDKILPGTLKHTLEGMYVGEYEGVFTLFDSNGKKADKPTVMHDGVDVTENYKFSYNPGKLTITGKHMDGGKEVENEVPEKNYLLGQKIPFTITVRSVSKDELKDVTVTDPTATILPDRNTANPAYTVSEDEHTATITSLAPEAEVIVYAEHEVTEDDIINRYTNEATINWGNDEVKVSKTPSIEEENPEAELVKEIVLQDGQDENHKFKLGETVYFKITVTNTGNVTLNEYEVKEVLPGAAFIDGTGYTLNNDKTVATIEKMEPVKDGQEAPDSNQIVLYAQYNIKEEDLGNKELKNIVTADNSKPGEVPIPVDEAKSVSGQKIWKDEGNAFNTRPASITLTLMRKLGQNGAAEQYRTMQLGSNGSWRYSFDHLPKHDAQENEYFYWVVEEPVTGYDTAYETKDESHCDIVNNLQTYTLTIHYWQHKLGDTKMEQAFPDYVATLYYKQPYDVESPEREGIILDDMSQARISGTMPAHDLVIDVYYHRIAYRLTIHYIYQDGTMAHEDYTWTYWFNSTYNVPSPIIPGFTPSIDVIAGRMPSHGLELTVVYVGDSEIVIPDEDTSLGFKSYLNAGECFE